MKKKLDLDKIEFPLTQESKEKIIKSITRRIRYDYFLVWGHGMQYLEEIIDYLDSQEDIKIIKIQKFKPENIEGLINAVYSYDYAPIEHLRAKTEYLKNTQREVAFIFVKNLYAIETYVGQGEYSHIEGVRIKQMKEDIRNLFNPKIDGKRSEEHVIHASDNQMQTDHILKYLGIPGLNKLKHLGNKILRPPYHIRDFDEFEVKEVDVTDLYATIISGDPENLVKTETAIENTPHFHALNGNKKMYELYLKPYKGIVFTDNHSLKKLLELEENFDADFYNNSHFIIVKKRNAGGYIIMDGVHRASVLRYKNIHKITVSIIK